MRRKIKPRSYYELFDGKRATTPWWKALIVRMFGQEIMRTNTATIYKFRGVFYVVK